MMPKNMPGSKSESSQSPCKSIYPQVTVLLKVYFEDLNLTVKHSILSSWSYSEQNVQDVFNLTISFNMLCGQAW